MRPQSWFVCDLQSGAPLVRNLFLYGDDSLNDYLHRHGVTKLPWLNASGQVPLFLSSRQKSRIEFGALGLVELVASRQHLQRPAKQRVPILDTGQISGGVAGAGEGGRR